VRWLVGWKPYRTKASAKAHRHDPTAIRLHVLQVPENGSDALDSSIPAWTHSLIKAIKRVQLADGR
jgi:hypothetical protein